MRVMLLSLLPVLFALALRADSHFYIGNASVAKHAEARKTPRIVTGPRSVIIKSVDDVLLYLKENYNLYKLPVSLDNISLSRVRQSLLGKHYVFQQIENGIKVRDGELIVSVDHDNGKIYQIFNNLFPINSQKIRAKNVVSKERALDIAWQSLKVHGPLIKAPNAKLEYRNIDGEVRLVFVTFIATKAPFGYFEHIIDATSGKILAKYDTSISRKKRDDWPQAIEDYNGPILNRKRAEQALSVRIMSSTIEAPLTPSNGSAFVFDPDPRTVLNNRDLKDDSDPSLFEDAYIQGELKDISFDGINYILKGPWVEIADFESPNTIPSTSENGTWTAKRGNNAFNDVMTYYHIDKNQRYIQSLGFIGERGIQFGSIKIDSDGVNGADNSHFIPYSNQIAFGHGCVDDNEDADVILHEYGHAIEHSINNSWGGGDTGAIGEGFGDYWAASYSISNEDWRLYYPEEIFSWDGHGNNNPCWPGRILNAFDARYNPDYSYPAHSGIEGGFQSDELWSTPLFQSLLELLNRGFKREEADRIVLEAHFGLGASVTMREMAESIVRTAQALYPEGPHKEIFLSNFIHHNIIDVPKAILSLGEVKVENTGNGYIDPGEEIHLLVPIKNLGSLEALNVQAKLTSLTPNVVIKNSDVDYGAIDLNGEQNNDEPFVVELSDDFSCGQNIEFELVINYEGGLNKEIILTFSLETGAPWPNPGSFHIKPNLSIPDLNLEGIVSTLSILGTNELIKASGLMVDIDINHTFIGDLKVTLISPKGTRVLLHNNHGGSVDNIIGTYPTTLTPHESFNKLEGEDLDGDWKLEVIDQTGMDIGTLNAWGIKAVFDHICE